MIINSKWKPKTWVSLVLASKGYPKTPITGGEIKDLNNINLF